MATISRLLKITGFFCERALYKRQYSAKQTYNFINPTGDSHPIVLLEEETKDKKKMLKNITRICVETKENKNLSRERWALRVGL